MYRFLNTITSNLVSVISASMFLGFLYGLVFPTDFLRMLVIPFAFFVVYPMMVNLKVEKVFKGDDIKLQLFTQVMNFCVVPFIAFGIGLIFFRDNLYMLLGMLLIGILPTGGGVISWTGILKGNLESATKMAVIGPIVGVILAPFYIDFLMGSDLSIDIMFIAKQIMLIIILPTSFGIVTRRFLLAKSKKPHSKNNLLSIFPSFSTIGIVGIVFVAMALRAKGLVNNPMMFIYVLMPLILFYFISFTIGTFIGRIFFNRASMIAFVYGSSMRNLSISLAIVISLFDGNGSGAALLITVAYIIQIQSAAWYARFTDRFFVRSKLPQPAKVHSPSY